VQFDYKPVVAFFSLSQVPGAGVECAYLGRHGGWNTVRAAVWSWEMVQEYWRQWLAQLRETINDDELPDLWTEAAKADESIAGHPSEGDNSPFTPDELTRIDEGLDRITGDVELKRLMSPQQWAELDKGAGRLKRLARMVGRIDWVNALTGWFLEKLGDAAISKPARDLIWKLANEAGTWLMKFLPKADFDLTSLNS
jgi:hypothetical protein